MFCRRSFAADPIAKDVMPRCMPAKNQPRNAVTTIRYRPAFERFLAVFDLDFDMA